MHRFRILATVVEAARVGADGSVVMRGENRVGDPGSWVVFDHYGGTSNWSHQEFLEAFEPADEEARLYLLSLE